VMFFILCSYLKASQNTWVSVKEHEEKSDSISPRRRAGANSVPIADAAKDGVSIAFLPLCA
jgi:hypothetical protein